MGGVCFPTHQPLDQILNMYPLLLSLGPPQVKHLIGALLRRATFQSKNFLRCRAHSCSIDTHKKTYCYSHRCHLIQCIHIFFYRDYKRTSQVTTSIQNPYSDQKIIKTRLGLTRLHYHLTSRIFFCIHHCNQIILTLIST